MQELFFEAVFFLLGLAVGSFLNVIIWRLEQGMDVVRLRSHCPNCKHVLGVVDLIPFLGFFIRRGRCRYCNVKISWQYPVVELATGMVFVIGALRILEFPFSPASLVSLLYFFAIAAVLIALAVYDFNYYLIPNIFVLLLLLLALIFQLVLVPFGIAAPLTSRSPIDLAIGVAISGFLFLLYAVSRGAWMGFGDVKLGFALGTLLGYPLIIEALLLAFISGGIVGIVLILTGQKTLKSHLPFGPFLAFAALFVVLWGKEFLALYLGMLT